MRKIVQQIPNLLTASNLVCGCVGLVFLLKGHYQLVPTAVLMAAFFDFLDGFAARLLKAHSTIGKDLDSLADMVSFGVLPGLCLFHIASIDTQVPSWLPWICLFYPVAAMFRLAIFNNDPEQKVDFKGLPSPAAAFWLISFVRMYEQMPSKVKLTLGSPWFMAGFCVVVGLLMVSSFRLFSLKFTKASIKANPMRNAWIIMTLAMVIAFHWNGVFYAIFNYLIFSFIHFKYQK
jgi:CDP-diacylglycerol--serine O-phosphatidyltransferase